MQSEETHNPLNLPGVPNLKPAGEMPAARLAKGVDAAGKNPKPAVEKYSVAHLVKGGDAAGKNPKPAGKKPPDKKRGTLRKKFHDRMFRRTNSVYVGLIGAGVHPMIIGDYSFAAAFIISGVVGLVMSWLTGDAVDGIKSTITTNGKETRDVITKDGDKTRNVIKEAISEDGDKTRNVIKEAISEDGDKTRKDNEETRAILREIVDVLKDMRQQ